MFLGSKKFLSGVNREKNPIATLAFSGSGNTGVPPGSQIVAISGDSDGYTKLGNGSFNSLAVIPQSGGAGFVPALDIVVVELNPGIYSLRLVSADITSGYSPYTPSTTASFGIEVARNNNTLSFPESITDRRPNTPISISTQANVSTGTGGQWNFATYTVSGGSYPAQDLTQKPYQILQQFTITSEDAERVPFGQVATDDTSVGIRVTASAPNSGLPFNSSLSLQLTRGFF